MEMMEVLQSWNTTTQQQKQKPHWWQLAGDVAPTETPEMVETVVLVAVVVRS
jgi:hypothetical protein